MSAENRSTLSQANAAVAEGRYEDFLAFCTDDTRWTLVGERVLEGKEAVRQWLAESYAEPPVNEVARMIGEGDFLGAIGEITVKDKDGKSSHYSYCDVWRFRDGKLFELQAFVIETAPAQP